MELTGHLGSCCGASFTITTESVMVLISEIVPAVCVPELPVTVSWELTTKTREASREASIEIGPRPTVMVFFSVSATASITLTKLPVQLGAWATIVVWFAPQDSSPALRMPAYHQTRP